MGQLCCVRKESLCFPQKVWRRIVLTSITVDATAEPSICPLIGAVVCCSILIAMGSARLISDIQLDGEFAVRDNMASARLFASSGRPAATDLAMLLQTESLVCTAMKIRVMSIVSIRRGISKLIPIVVSRSDCPRVSRRADLMSSQPLMRRLWRPRIQRSYRHGICF